MLVPATRPCSCPPHARLARPPPDGFFSPSSDGGGDLGLRRRRRRKRATTSWTATAAYDLGGGGDGAGTHHTLLGRGNHTWIPVAFVGLARAVGGTARAARPPPPSACINQVNSRRLALGPAVPQTKSGTRCGVRPAGSCLLLRPRPCTARPWYYRTVGERVARSRAACVPRLRHTL